MTRQELTQRIIWDYNANPEEVYLCVKGRIPNALHFDRESLFRYERQKQYRDELNEIHGCENSKLKYRPV